MADTSRIGLRLASREDAEFILTMIRDLADYEHALDEVHATAGLLEQWLFDTPVAECLIASLDGADRGIALFFTNFSTWEARPGFFLEDLYVQPEARKHGLGLALFRELARLALERGYTRLDWNCYDWNEPSLAFYRSLGAIARTEWIPHRLTRETMEALVAGRESGGRIT
jgi:GNAT superfamily N-acetyltransferase